MMGDRLFCQHTKKALLSISDGRASSFFNTFIKIITPPPFLRAADFGCKDTKKNREIQRNPEKFGEIRRKIREIRRKIRENQRKSENLRENRIKTEKIREFKRKSEKNGELSVNLCAYPQELSVNLWAYL